MKPTINKSAGHTFQQISPSVDPPANVPKVHYEPTTQYWLTSSFQLASQTLGNSHLKPGSQTILVQGLINYTLTGQAQSPLHYQQISQADT